ncbi:hypothetical protein PINS_up011368 [Pythium insidiosum]|nr:hypothetical protein PINS_up011368 [Pythium insidiosum]
MLALALLHDDVPVLLMDEPSAGVDVVARRLMWKVLHDRRQSNREVSCLFTTHSMEEAEAVCANAVVLSKGKVVWSGSIPELKQHASRGISISLRLDTTSIWDPERVRYYVDKIRWMLLQRESSSALSASSANASARSALVSEGRIPGDELERAWELCRQHYPRSRSRDDPTRPSPQGQRWITGVLSRLESEARGTDAPSSSSSLTPSVARTTSAASSGSSTPTDLSALSMDMSEFVKEWLVRETFNTIESQLFEDEISARSGQEVRAVDLQNALGSGSNTTAVYETTCTSRFGLVDAFKVLETHKSTFSIARYSISELSLERVFEQLT